jgi:hypothetical protein
MTFNFLLSLIAAAVSSILALLALFRNRHSLVHWIFGIGMMVLAIEAVFTGLSFYALLPAAVLRWQRFRFIATAFLPGIWLLFSLTFGRLNYKEFIARWKWVILATFVLPIILVTIFGKTFFSEGPLVGQSEIELIKMGWPGYGFHLILLISAILILMNLEKTLRISSGRMRWQIKFMVLGLGSLFGVRIYTASQNLQLINTGALIVASALIFKSLLRARVLNVDFYVSQTFLYNSLVILFIGIYLLVVGAMAKLATYFEAPIPLPIGAFLFFLGLLGLAIILLSDRLRKHLKYFIGRHLSRPIYDYRKEWTKFTERTTSVTQIKDLCSVVAKIVSETSDVLSVTIWLVNEGPESIELGGSTVFSERQLLELSSVRRDVKELIQFIRQSKPPIDFDYSKGGSSKEENGSNGKFYLQTRIRYCFPLIGRGRFLGVMTLGDPVGRDDLSAESFDLLKTIANQTAGSLLNLKLAADLRQAKEMEAFQAMSAFFVHDLKNLASSLSLTTQNLAAHFGNPDFRKDAVQTISQSLNRINIVCSQLSSLSQRLELHPMLVDLNDLVRSTLSGLNGSGQVITGADLQPVSRIPLDLEQIQKVLVNLILNAREALKDGGEIRVATMQRDGFVVLSVTDTGCGMSQDFIQNSLFRPFKTTKKQGMGIGLYQSKMIVEAHGGRIEVESEEGKGSTFRVFLPMAGK